MDPLTIMGLVTGGLSLAGGLSSLFGGGDRPGVASFAATNPAAQFLASLFGGGFGTENNAPSFEAYKPGQSYELIYPTSIFGSEQRQAIKDWLTPLGFSPIEQQAMDLFGEDVGSTYEGTTDFFDQFIMPTAQQLITDGFRTDIDPIRELMQRNFQMETLPGLREQFLGQTGSFSSDFLGSAAQAGADMWTELGAIQAELDEAAAQRRATGLPVASQLALARQDLPIAVANSALDFGGRSRLAQEALRPGGRVLDVLGLLGGMGAPSNMGFVGSGVFPSQTSQLLAGLGQAAPGFAAAGNLLSGLFNKGGGTSGGGTAGGNFSFFG